MGITGLCCDTFVAEGASEAEIEEEVAVIKTQLAYVKQMRGNLDDALSDYRNVLKLKYATLLLHLCCVFSLLTFSFDVAAGSVTVLWELWLRTTS